MKCSRDFYYTMISLLVEKNGDVCISILHEPGDDKWGYEKASERWLPVHTVETILISVISMLADPNDESPANVDAAVRLLLTHKYRIIHHFIFIFLIAERVERKLYRIQKKGGKVCAEKPRRMYVGYKEIFTWKDLFNSGKIMLSFY